MRTIFIEEKGFRLHILETKAGCLSLKEKDIDITFDGNDIEEFLELAGADKVRTRSGWYWEIHKSGDKKLAYLGNKHFRVYISLEEAEILRQIFGKGRYEYKSNCC